jgi:hypothetical protein
MIGVRPNWAPGWSAFRFYETHRAEIDRYIADNLADD